MKDWELSFGFYPGIMMGFRSYKETDKTNHVLYIPFMDACLTTYNEAKKDNHVFYIPLVDVCLTVYND